MMPRQLGGAIPDWDLSQYPGIGGTSATTPIPLESQVAALINGGQLTGGDKLARISDLRASVEANTYQITPAPFAANDGKIATMQSLAQKNIITLAPATGVTITRLEAWINANREFNFCGLVLLSAAAAASGFLIPILSGAPPGVRAVVTAGIASAAGGFAHAGLTYHSLEITVAASGIMSIGIASNSTAAVPANTYVAICGKYILDLNDAVS